MERPEVELVVTARRRASSRLDDGSVEPADDRSIEELVRALPGDRTRVWLCGGEPTLRSDLPELIGRVRALGHAPGLVSDALALSSERAIEPLCRAGLDRVRVILHAARPDAHDWLVELPGAARRAVRAMAVLRARGIGVELDATVTRSTLPLLAELVEAAAGLGARVVRLHRLVLGGPVARQAVALTPRHAMLGPELERAVSVGSRCGVEVLLYGFPECATASAAPSRATVPRIFAREPEWAPGCASCPGGARCLGFPADYVAIFGRDELEQRPPSHVPEVVRFRFGAPSVVACQECGDRGGRREQAIESTRRVRARLVRAAGGGARALRVVSAGSLAHPEAAALLREATLLGFDRVEVAGEASELDRASDRELYALSGITRFDVALFGPDAASHDQHVGRPGAFDAALRVAERLGRLARVETGSYAVLHDASRVTGFARAWSEGQLPGAPRFRLSSRGGSLDELGKLARDELPGPARAALARVLPPCLCPGQPVRLASEMAFEDTLVADAARSGCDPEGDFGQCACGGERAASCPGVARGWRPGA